MRENFSLMKSLSAHTRVDPNGRIKKLMDFHSRLRRESNVKKELSEWNMVLDDKLVEFPARLLPPEKIIFGGGVTIQPEGGEWSREMQKKRCLVVQPLKNWIVVALERDSRSIQVPSYVHMMH